MQVIEEALERVPLPDMSDEVKRRRIELEEIVDGFDASRIPSMPGFDAQTYGDRGLPR